MLSELCRELRNWFEQDIVFNTFTVKDGTLKVPEAQNGQYIRIVGSVFNDGVYKYPVENLTDETFKGAVWLMAVPPEVVSLSEEIDNWQKKNADILLSPYQSESFGGYSYTKASGSESGSGTTWKSAFSDRLARWRKI